MKHTKYLRAGSLVCLLALCLGLLTACGGATLPLDKLYVDDARPGKPITLNTATEVFREKHAGGGVRKPRTVHYPE